MHTFIRIYVLPFVCAVILSWLENQRFNRPKTKKCITEGRGGGGVRLLDTREYNHTSNREHGLQVACTMIDGSTVVHMNGRTVVYVRINRSMYTRMEVW